MFNLIDLSTQTEQTVTKTNLGMWIKIKMRYLGGSLMYRFEKKATLVCAAASLITACCLPLTANVAFAQDSVEAQSIESKADFLLWFPMICNLIFLPP